jgi:hypothetical protein
MAVLVRGVLVSLFLHFHFRTMIRYESSVVVLCYVYQRRFAVLVLLLRVARLLY